MYSVFILSVVGVWWSVFGFRVCGVGVVCVRCSVLGIGCFVFGVSSSVFRGRFSVVGVLVFGLRCGVFRVLVRRCVFGVPSLVFGLRCSIIGLRLSVSCLLS